ncbi:uncharacterized protein LOC129408312 [Boleophthalmus pectinirostris]|uniref:uncharacterized protein LOC129408312 n=1 Tax=Boleophthalmus pectinirostris TaxID=150288 RepID=UPI0024323D30|nr:uncharacterized protein LOC129408312 [Boleophthalmus pectinirostris]
MACCKRRLRSTTLNKEMEIQENDASSGVPIAPTASLRNQRKLEEIKMLEMKLEFQNEKMKELREDNNFLKEQLAAALKKTDPGPSSYSLVSSDTSNIERDSVEATSSNDISPNDTSSDEKKKNKRIKKRKDRTLALKYCQRAQGPKRSGGQVQENFEDLQAKWHNESSLQKVWDGPQYSYNYSSNCRIVRSCPRKIQRNYADLQ